MMMHFWRRFYSPDAGGGTGGSGSGTGDNGSGTQNDNDDDDEEGSGTQERRGRSANGGGSGGRGNNNQGGYSAEIVADLRDEAAHHRTKKNEALKQVREKNAEIETLKKQLEEANSYKTKWETVEKDRKDELLKKLPEDKREKYKDWSLDQLKVVVEDFATAAEAEKDKPTDSQGVERGGDTTNDAKSLDGMTQEQQAQLLKTNPELYNKLLAEQIKKRGY